MLRPRMTAQAFQVVVRVRDVDRLSAKAGVVLVGRQDDFAVDSSGAIDDQQSILFVELARFRASGLNGFALARINGERFERKRGTACPLPGW